MSTGVSFSVTFDMSALKCYEAGDHFNKNLPKNSFPSWQCGMSRGDGTNWIKNFVGSVTSSGEEVVIPYNKNCTGNDYADLIVGGYRSGDQDATMTCTGHLNANSQINLTVPYFFGNY